MSSTRKVNLFSTNIPRCWYVRTRPDQNKDSSQPKFKWWGRGGGVLKLAVKNPLWSGDVEDHIFCCRANFGAEHSVALIEGGLKPHVFAAQLRERQAGLRVFFFCAQRCDNGTSTASVSSACWQQFRLRRCALSGCGRSGKSLRFAGVPSL